MSNLSNEDLAEIPDSMAGGDGSFGEPGDTSRTSSKRSVQLEAEDLHLAKQMIETGLGADLNDLTQKSLRYYGAANFNNVMHGEPAMMNEQIIDALSSGDDKSPMETAMAAQIMQGVAGNNQNDDSMDLTEIMKMKMLMGEGGGGQPQQQQQGTNSGMDMMQLVMLDKLGGSDDSGIGESELIQVMKEMQDSGSDGMDPAMMMMLNNDSDGDDPYKEFMEMYKQNQEQQTQLQQQVMEEKFGNELETLQRQVKSVAEKAQEAEQSDMDQLLGQMEQVEKFARKLGMTESNGDGGDDTAQTMERLIDTVGEHMGPAMEKYMESQAGGGAPANGAAQPAQAAQPQAQRAQEVQQAREAAQSSPDVAPEPTPDDVAF